MTFPLVPISFKSFESAILYFNGMYKLPIAPEPSLIPEADWQRAKFPDTAQPSDGVMIAQRIRSFFQIILQDELEEHHKILEDLALSDTAPIDVLVSLADLLGDIIVFCASEMARYGIPQKETLDIIMQSNFSKLGADGKPIYDADGKVQKGPEYWKPEPKLKAMLLQARGESE